MNNRQAGRRRGRGGQRPQGGSPNQGNGNRIDNRARGNAAQLLEKYRNLARDAQMQGDRVNTEYYLQFADHYFRVLNENRSRYEEQNQRQQRIEAEDEEESFSNEAASLPQSHGHGGLVSAGPASASPVSPGIAAGHANGHATVVNGVGDEEARESAAAAPSPERDTGPRRRTRTRRETAPVIDQSDSRDPAQDIAAILPPALTEVVASESGESEVKPRRRRRLRSEDAEAPSAA